MTDLKRFSGGAAYVRGQFVPLSEANISITDWGFTRSDAVYDVVHVFQHGFFRLDDHLDRFMRSMAMRRLNPVEGRAEIEGILHRCVALACLDDAYVAVAALRGRPRVAGSRRIEECDNHLIAYAIPWIDVIAKDVQERGTRLWIGSTPRVPDASVDPTVKNYQWSDITSGLIEAQDHGYDSVVLCDSNGFVTEGAGFNIFVVKDGIIFTPDRGSLHGITRKSVMELCDEYGLNAQVAPISRESLESADEVFVTSTAGGVIAITRVATTILGNDKPGAITAILKDAYWKKHTEGWHRTQVRALDPAFAASLT